MRIIVAIAVACLTLTSARTSFGDDGFGQVAEQGEWVKFFATMKGPNTDLTVELRMADVGGMQLSGEDYRWIEFHAHDTSADRHLNTHKMLIPVEKLKKGPFGVDDVHKAWLVDPDNTEPVEVDQSQLGPWQFLFPGSLENAERPDKSEKVQWQKGQLECRILTGTSTAKLGNQDAPVKHRYLLSKEVPFGLGGFNSTVDMPDGSQLKLEARLKEKGKGAESELPNAN